MSISSRFQPQIRSRKSAKIAKNRKKCNFSKFEDIRYSGRKYDIWPEIDSLDPGKSLESLYWPSYTIRSNFEKNQKNPIFDLQNPEKKFFPADYSGRCDPAIKTILGIKTSYMCPKGPIMSPHPHPPLHTYTGLQIFTGPQQNPLFFSFSHIYTWGASKSWHRISGHCVVFWLYIVKTLYIFKLE